VLPVAIRSTVLLSPALTESWSLLLLDVLVLTVSFIVAVSKASATMKPLNWFADPEA
jgi:hypothetical protein